MGKKNWIRYLLGAVSVVYIVYLWTEKNMAGIYAAMPKEQLIPMIATSAGVTLVKIALLTGIFLLVKGLREKLPERSKFSPAIYG